MRFGQYRNTRPYRAPERYARLDARAHGGTLSAAMLRAAPLTRAAKGS
ncbi:hypothetical protein [Croceicoccus hydrothermalis]|nr:hypothetical protein [Croceicoccus hydrothermalis]